MSATGREKKKNGEGTVIGVVGCTNNKGRGATSSRGKYIQNIYTYSI